MEKEKQRRQEMIDYLNTLKFAHQSHALNEISRHGSDQYAQHEMDKAQMVEEIISYVKLASQFIDYAGAEIAKDAIDELMNGPKPRPTIKPGGLFEEKLSVK